MKPAVHDTEKADQSALIEFGLTADQQFLNPKFSGFCWPQGDWL